MVGAELDTLAAQDLKGMAQHQQLGLGVHSCAVDRLGVKCGTNFHAAIGLVHPHKARGPDKLATGLVDDHQGQSAANGPFMFSCVQIGRNCRLRGDAGVEQIP